MVSTLQHSTVLVLLLALLAVAANTLAVHPHIVYILADVRMYDVHICQDSV